MFRIAVVLALLAGVAGGLFYLWSLTPEYAITQVKDAIKAHDKSKFDKFVDTDQFADSMAEDMLGKPIKEAMGGSMLGRWISAGVSGIFKPRFTARIKADLYDIVEQGHVNQPDASDVDPEMSLGAVDRQLCLSRNEFKKLDNMKKDGAVTTCTVVLHNKEHDKDFKLDLQLQNEDGHWRVAKMLNFPEFVSQLIEIESTHQDRTHVKGEAIRRI